MARQQNPNSLKNLEKGKPYQFKKGEKRPPEHQQKANMTKLKNASVKNAILKMAEVQLPIDKAALKQIAKLYGKPVKDITNIDIATYKFFVNAIKSGDLNHLTFIRDMLGEKPTEKVQVSTVDDETAAEVERMVSEAMVNGVNWDESEETEGGE